MGLLASLQLRLITNFIEPFHCLPSNAVSFLQNVLPPFSLTSIFLYFAPNKILLLAAAMANIFLRCEPTVEANDVAQGETLTSG